MPRLSERSAKVIEGAYRVAPKCPKCERNWEGEDIPEENRAQFGGRRKFSLAILQEEEGKGLAGVKCPFCKGEFPL
jgi:phage FluMu protein Com